MGTVLNVPFTMIDITQPCIRTRKAAHFLRLGAGYPPIPGVAIAGRVVIPDGHHRLVAAYLRGDDAVRVELFGAITGLFSKASAWSSPRAGRRSDPLDVSALDALPDGDVFPDAKSVAGLFQVSAMQAHEALYWIEVLRAARAVDRLEVAE